MAAVRDGSAAMRSPPAGPPRIQKGTMLVVMNESQFGDTSVYTSHIFLCKKEGNRTILVKQIYAGVIFFFFGVWMWVGAFVLVSNPCGFVAYTLTVFYHA